MKATSKPSSNNQLKLGLTAALGLYLLSYGIARINVFHTVEAYEENIKGNPQQNYIAKVDRPAGEGWEYQLFLPLIKAEEVIVNFFQNL